jgi:decaprenylphospho-beta-D-ribofuranose 2-oxidase
LPNRETVTCSPDKNEEIFWATVGGMGMTGFIEEVTLKLMPISSTKMKVEKVRVSNLAEMIARFQEGVGNSEYMVGWIDHFGKDAAIGRGVFERAVHVKKPDGSLVKYKNSNPKISIPFFLPSFVLNKFTMAIFNKIKFFSVKNIPTSSVQDFQGFFHPLDGIENWNRLYGKRGFLQYQCLVPDGEDVLENIRIILKTIQERGLFSFLAVIKYHGPQEGMMSFSKDGFSLALDFPNTPAVHVMLDEIDEFLCNIGGRVYLGKDARMKSGAFEKMYAHALPKWRKILKQIDPKGKIHSSMARRLGFKEKH